MASGRLVWAANPYFACHHLTAWIHMAQIFSLFVTISFSWICMARPIVSVPPQVNPKISFATSSTLSMF